MGKQYELSDGKGNIIESYDTRTQEDLENEVVARRDYGTVEEQIEYAVENGFEALITKNLAIKAAHPKP